METLKSDPLGPKPQVSQEEALRSVKSGSDLDRSVDASAGVRRDRV